MRCFCYFHPSQWVSRRNYTFFMLRFYDSPLELQKRSGGRNWSSLRTHKKFQDSSANPSEPFLCWVATKATTRRKYRTRGKKKEELCSLWNKLPLFEFFSFIFPLSIPFSSSFSRCGKKEWNPSRCQIVKSRRMNINNNNKGEAGRSRIKVNPMTY